MIVRCVYERYKESKNIFIKSNDKGLDGLLEINGVSYF
jgi:hypothetical protein